MWGVEQEIVFQVTVQRGRLEESLRIGEILEPSGILGCQKEEWGKMQHLLDLFQIICDWMKLEIEKVDLFS